MAVNDSTSAGSAGIDWRAELARHDRWLRAVVLARLGSWQGVDEIMQEVALAAVRQQAPLRDRERVAPWLYRLAVTQALLYRRRLGRARRLAERYADRTLPTEQDNREPDPLEWLLADERQRLVRVALEKLPGRDAEILLMKYAEDCSYHEIADRLGVSHSAVEARLHRARERLRRELEHTLPNLSSGRAASASR
ncbi:MAG: sigma-70 family RNA polymerase sigma factor [Planctomycetes bacterium]|nr:sigma-70 family RNA polymerase sigma factor [Planctomycetota bacterium]